MLLLVGAGILLHPKAYLAMTAEVSKSVALVYLFGLVEFTAGLAIVLTHNVWHAVWRTMITLFGWIVLLRGATRVVLPETFLACTAKLFSYKHSVPIAGAVLALVGLVLCHFGYVVPLLRSVS
jgi:hypothetical protein